MNTQTNTSISRLFALAGLTALAPLAIDAYLPAMPTMAEQLGVSIHDIELTLSLFLAGFAAGQLIGGPFSDQVGRRRSIFTGMAVYLAGTIGIIFSSNVEALWLFRIIQAFGGGLAIVNTAAIIRDTSSGVHSARNLAHIAMIMMTAPLLAPLLGAGMLHLTGWRGIFAALLLYGIVLGTVIWRTIPETRREGSAPISAKRRYGEILSHRQAMGYALSQSFSYAGMFAFITASPLVYIEYFGISEASYPLCFGINIIGLMVFNRINVRLLRNYSPATLLRVGQGLQILIISALLIYLWQVSQPTLQAVVTLIAMAFCCQALIVSNASACTIEFFPHSSATAAALLGASGFMFGAISGSLVSFWGDGTPLPMAITMMLCSLTGFTLRELLHLKPAN